MSVTYRAFPPRRVERILLNVMLPIGDTLFTTPAIRGLRQRFPEARIVALAFATNAGVLRANDDIDEIILHPTGQTFTPLAYLAFILRMRRRRFTVSVEFRPYTWWMSTFFGIWHRVGSPMSDLKWILPGGKRPWKHRHAVVSYAEIVTGIGGIHVDTTRLIVRATDDDRAAIDAFLAAEGIARGEELIVFHPGGEGFRGMKRWEPRRFAVLAARLLDRQGDRIVIMGGRDELALAHEVVRWMEPAARTRTTIVNGRVSLGGSIAVLERCALFVGNDSAPMHMAASLGRPTVGIFGPTSVENYAPIGPHTEVVRSGLVCSPCFYFVGSDPVWATSHCRVPTCLHAVSVAAVLAAAGRVVASLAAGPARTDEQAHFSR